MRSHFSLTLRKLLSKILDLFLNRSTAGKASFFVEEAADVVASAFDKRATAGLISGYTADLKGVEGSEAAVLVFALFDFLLFFLGVAVADRDFSTSTLASLL